MHAARRKHQAAAQPTCHGEPGESFCCVSPHSVPILTIPELLNLSVGRLPHDSPPGTARLTGVPRIGWDWH
jgi:hypothetical protein